MSFGRSNYGSGLLLALGLSSFLAVQVRAADTPKPGRALGVSETNTLELLKTLDQLGGGRGQQLQDELNSPVTRSSLSGVVAPVNYPPAPIVLPSRRAREQEDRRKNWVFQDPASYGSIFGGDTTLPDKEDDLGDQQKNRTSLEEFYLRLSQPRGGEPKSGGRNDLSLPQNQSSRANTGSDDTSLPSGIRETEQKLKRALGEAANEPSSLTPTPVRSTFSDFFGLGVRDKGPTAQDLAAHKAFMDEYRKVLDSRPATTVNPLDAAFTATPAPPQAVTFGTLDPLNGPVHKSQTPVPAATPAAVNALLQPGTLFNPNNKVLNDWNPLYVPPKPEAPKPVTLSVPMMEVPRRRF